MTERETILQVLTHAIELGVRSKYDGVRFYKLHDSTIVEFEKELKKELKQKKELFKRLDEKSNTYNIILSTAKLSLDKLRVGDFDKTSAELINLFLSLQSVFKNKLQFIECKQQEDVLVKQVIENKETEEEKLKRLKISKRKIREVIYLEPGVTADKKRKKTEKETERKEMFSNASDLNF